MLARLFLVATIVMYVCMYVWLTFQLSDYDITCPLWLDVSEEFRVGHLLGKHA